MFPARNVSPILTKSPLSPNTGLEVRVMLPFLSHFKLLSRKVCITRQLCLDLEGGGGGTGKQKRERGVTSFIGKKKGTMLS